MRVSLEKIERFILLELAGGTAYPVEMPSGCSTHGRSSSTNKNKSSSCSYSAGPSVSQKIALMQTMSSLGGAEDVDDSTVAAAVRDDLAKQMVVIKTTPLDLVQQTAMLLIPELQKINIESKGRLPSPEELVKQADAVVEEQAPPQDHTDGGKSSTDADSGTMDIKLMIEASLLLICEDAGIEYGVELTVDVMRDILHAFSETHWDDETVEQMVRAASSGTSDREIPVLDCNTFLRALTADLSRYRTEWTNKASTFIQDVNSNERVTDVGLPPPPMTSFYSLPSIDYTADTYSNYIWAILSWFLFMLTFGTYLWDKFLNDRLVGVDCDPTVFTTFGCRVINSSVVWLEVFIRVNINEQSIKCLLYWRRLLTSLCF
jgi:hypothetical protein